jgi:predicted metal-dependent hydrolase
MPSMTLFDVSDLFGTEPPPERPSDGPSGAPDAQGRTEPTRPAVPSEPLAPLREVDTVERSPEVEVRISKRRKKTSEAKWVGGRIVVSLPAHLDVESRQKTIDWLVERLLTRHQLQSGLDDDGLLARAIELSDRYLVGARPDSVRWVTNQTARWGSCSYYSGHIRVSHRLRVVPGWVLDSVLVHEVAHLTHPDHSRAFHKLAGAYPRHEEAGVFLAGYGLGLSNPAS